MYNNLTRFSQSNRLRIRNYRQKRKIIESEKKSANSSKKLCMQDANKEESTLPNEIGAVVQPVIFQPNEMTTDEQSLVQANIVPSQKCQKESVFETVVCTSKCDTEDLKINFDRFSSESDTDSDDSDESECSNGAEDVAINCETSDKLDIAEDLRIWSKKFIVPYSHVDGLLSVLKPYHSNLPLSSKTLMKKKYQSKHEIRKFNPNAIGDDSEYVYFGIEKQLKRIINSNLHEDKSLKLQFHFDGLPLYSSSSKEFWPVLGKVYTNNNLYQPFVIAVHCGKGKPTCVKLYLKEFTEELNKLLDAGIDIDGKHFTITVMCMICDRPARAFVKCIKGHTGYYACERCTVHGCRINNKTVFPVDEGELRTDTSFRNLENIDHHHDISPLVSINPSIDMVKDFPLDVMHLGCLGIMKRLLIEYWTKTSTKILKRNEILQISQRLMNLSKQVPTEFQRTTRSLGEISKWKATEYRFFLLYSGMFVLKNILPDNLYKHFLLLSIAIRILSSRSLYNVYLDPADSYLKKFATLAQEESMYGKDALVLNFHSLTHLSDDVRHFNCPLDDISAFSFENTLGKMKKYLRSGNKPLSQLCRRLEEDYILDKNKPRVRAKSTIIKSKTQKAKGKSDKLVISKMQFNDCDLSTKSPDNVVLLKNHDVLQIVSMHSVNNTNNDTQIYLVGKKLKVIEPALDYPTNSSVFDIFKVTSNDSSEMVTTMLDTVKCKMVLLTIIELEEDVGESYVVPILHMN